MLSDSLSNPKRERRACQRQMMGTKSSTGNGTELSVMLLEACVCVGFRLWPLRREDSSRVLIGAAGTWRSDWRRRDVGVLIGQSDR